MFVTEVQQAASVQCTMCLKPFKSRSNLLYHIKNEHGEQRGPFNCMHCGHIMKNRNSLRVHIYQYHKEKKPQTISYY
ncbi:hypothetical protein PR048_021797 [Dryococelus australis]|uniref:C2H2-type domain-containing protein n=1 Tax=Dryococelus australis TaxID=614101 RepID=A0ABQ9GZE5_9NEOP|nr:hypothetical protein PR048_021797 [Dryococelus australis]